MAREICEGAPAPLRWFVIAGCKLVLGFRTGPVPSSDHILGWRIASRATDEVVCQLGSGFLNVYNTLRRVEGALVWSTFVNYKRPWARFSGRVAANAA